MADQRRRLTVQCAGPVAAWALPHVSAAPAAQGWRETAPVAEYQRLATLRQHLAQRLFAGGRQAATEAQSAHIDQPQGRQAGAPAALIQAVVAQAPLRCQRQALE